MNENGLNPIDQRSTRIIGLTSPSSPIEERIDLTLELLPPERKHEILANASKDSKGRPVRYFRLMGHEELRNLMSIGESSGIGNPNVRTAFSNKQQEIAKAIEQDYKLKQRYSKEIDDLLADFNYNSYIHFLYAVISRIELLKIHIFGEDIGLQGKTTGLTSLSVGLPLSPPCYPHLKSDSGPGFVAAEFSIPDNEVIASPLYKKYPNLQFEREIDTHRLLNNWLIDIYHDSEDLERRFLTDEGAVINSLYKSKLAEVGYIQSQDNLFMDYKYSESFEDSLPISTLPRLDTADPIWQQPFSPR